MLRATGALVIALLAASAAEAAKVTNGCWSPRSSRFNENCDVAFLALVTQSIYLDGKKEFVSIVNYKQTYKYRDCTAEWKSDGRSVPFKDIMKAYSDMTKKCQSGYIYFDKGWLNMNIVSGSGRKRDVDSDVVTAGGNDMIERQHARDVLVSVARAGEAEETEEETGADSYHQDILETQHADGNDDNGNNDNNKAISARAGPSVPGIGTYIRTMEFAGFAFEIYRTNGIPPIIGPMHYQLGQGTPHTIAGMIGAAARDGGNAILRVGLSPDVGSAASSIALAVHIGDAHFGLSWRNLLSLVDQGSFAVVMIARILGDFTTQGFHSASYRIWQDGFFYFTVTIHAALPQ